MEVFMSNCNFYVAHVRRIQDFEVPIAASKDLTIDEIHAELEDGFYMEGHVENYCEFVDGLVDVQFIEEQRDPQEIESDFNSTRGRSSAVIVYRKTDGKGKVVVTGEQYDHKQHSSLLLDEKEEV
jgi:hypothetical protein